MSRLTWVTALGTCLALWNQQVAACSMCHCGDPVYRAIGQDLFGEQRFHVGFDVDRYAKQNAVIETPEALPAAALGLVAPEVGTESEDELRFTLSGSWQALPMLRLVARIPVASRSIEAFGSKESLTGIADPELYAHIRITPAGGAASGWAALMLGGRAPLGQSALELDGAVAEEHLQPGTGAGALFAGLSGSRTVGRFDHVYGSVMGRWNGANDRTYRYGDALLVSLAYQHELHPSLGGVLELDFRAAEPDHRQGAVEPHTGGSVFYLSPRLDWVVRGPAALRLGVQIPVLQNHLGDQDEKMNLLSGLSIRL